MDSLYAEACATRAIKLMGSPVGLAECSGWRYRLSSKHTAASVFLRNFLRNALWEIDEKPDFIGVFFGQRRAL